MVKTRWTLEDLNQLATVDMDLRRLGVLSIGFDYSRTSVHLRPEALADLAGVLGRQPDKRVHLRGDYWRCSLWCGEIELFSLFRPEELPMIGYPEEPLPPNEETDPETAAARQAS